MPKEKTATLTFHIEGHLIYSRMPMIVTELNISCIWNGTLAGILLKNDAAITSGFGQTTVKIIGIHGWLDNLNSLLPLAKQLIDRHPNYEIYLYDRAGHGFSSHIPKGFDYSTAHNMQDLRTVVQTLGWNKEKFSIIGHSFGALLGMMYAACYPDEISCLVALDALLRGIIPTELFWKTTGSHIDINLQYLGHISKSYEEELTYEKALEFAKRGRPGINDEAARLLTERSVRRDTDNKLHFTRDESLKILPTIPYTDAIVQNAIDTIKASILFIGAIKPIYPHSQRSAPLFKQQHPHFEMTLIDGPHHFHMTHVDQVVDRIEQYFNKYLQQSSTPMIKNSKL